MKRIYPVLFVLAASLALVSCREEVLDPVSVITLDQRTQNDFDKWLDANYVTPYNILVKYRYESNESDLNYWTIPARLDCSIVMAHLVKYLCIDTYDEVGGVRFTQKYFPKEFFYIGEWEYKNNGTYILGTAEGGKKILLSGLNYLPQVLTGGYQGYNDPASALNHFYIKTIHHEFTHLSLYVTNTDETVQGWLAAAGREVTEADVKSDEFKVSFPNLEVGQHFNGDQLILAKLAQVRKYMADTFNIDIDQLRAAVLRRQADVVAGDVDLTSLDVN